MKPQLTETIKVNGTDVKCTQFWANKFTQLCVRIVNARSKAQASRKHFKIEPYKAKLASLFDLMGNETEGCNVSMLSRHFHVTTSTFREPKYSRQCGAEINLAKPDSKIEPKNEQLELQDIVDGQSRANSSPTLASEIIKRKADIDSLNDSIAAIQRQIRYERGVLDGLLFANELKELDELKGQ